MTQTQSDSVANGELSHWHEKVWYPLKATRDKHSLDPLQRPIYWGKSRIVSVGTDLFAADVTEAQRDRCMAIMALRPQHTFVLLSPHVAAMQRYLERFSWDRAIRNCCDAEGASLINAHTHQALAEQLGPRPQVFSSFPKRNLWPLRNIWVGARVCDQRTARDAIRRLAQMPAARRWISIEPTGPVVLGPQIATLDWVVCAGQRGAEASPMHPEWPQSLADECEKVAVPFRFESWGEWCPRGPESFGHVSVENVPRRRITNVGENGQRLGARGGNDVWVNRAGHRRTGRTLYAEIHNQIPFHAASRAEACHSTQEHV